MNQTEVSDRERCELWSTPGHLSGKREHGAEFLLTMAMPDSSLNITRSPDGYAYLFGLRESPMYKLLAFFLIFLTCKRWQLICLF